MIKNTKTTAIYTDNEILTDKFHNFISRIFPQISFKEWRAKGFWTEKFIPFSIIDSGEILSNASATFLSILIDGHKHNAIQLGGIGTLPQFRHQGLARHLIHYILNRFKETIDFYFLFANETVLDFYPKFGFRKVNEYLFIADAGIPAPEYSARKLNIENEDDYSLLLDLINNRKSLTKIFSAEDYGFITMWHIFNLYRDDLYYLEKEDAIIIKKEECDTLSIIEVIFRNPFDIRLALPKIIKSNRTKSIAFYFPPDQLSYTFDRIVEKDTGLFVLSELEIGDDPFRFPLTAIT